MGRKYTMQDDSVTLPGFGAAARSGKSVTRRGEDARKPGPEPGRFDTHTGHHSAGKETERAEQTGKSTARDSTSVNPLDPIDPRSPNLRP